jgi:hypothetical protein
MTPLPASTDQSTSNSVDSLKFEWIVGLHRNESHCGPFSGFCDCFAIDVVVRKGTVIESVVRTIAFAIVTWPG